MQNIINNYFALGGDPLGKIKQRLYLSTQRERKGQKILHIMLLYFLKKETGKET